MSYIKLRKEWEDSDEMLQVEFSASNGVLATTQDFYVYPDKLYSFGRDLEGYFPVGGEGVVEFEYGSETDNVYCFLKLKFFYINSGTIGIHIRTNNKQEGHKFAVAEFCIESTLYAVNDLGRKIVSWSRNNDKPLECNLTIS